MNEPIFQAVFGAQWSGLPVVLQRRYANRPLSTDVVTLDGLLTVHMSLLSRLMAPLFGLTGTLVPYEGENIPVTVELRSDRDSNACHFDRTFRFPERPAYRFESTLHSMKGADVIEATAVGIGWLARYTVENGTVRIAHRGYRMKLFGHTFKLPLEWLLGSATAEEEALDGNRFRMAMQIVHPLVGIVYGYHGTFAITSVRQAD